MTRSFVERLEMIANEALLLYLLIQLVPCRK